MKKFRIIAVIDEENLGAVMGAVLERDQDLEDCSLIFEPPPSKPKPASAPRKHAGGGNRGVGEAAKLEVSRLVAEERGEITRKQIRERMPGFTSSSMDGALTWLTKMGQIVRVSPGVYRLKREQADG